MTGAARVNSGPVLKGGAVVVSNAIQQPARPHLESCSQFENIGQADIALAALNPAHIVAMELGSLREGLLGHAASKAKIPDYLAKGHLEIRAGGHDWPFSPDDHYRSTHGSVAHCGVYNG